jgi:hypothetical protein
MGVRTTGLGTRLALLVTVLLAAGLGCALTAPAASAADKAVTPAPSCYFANGDGTVTVTVDVTNDNPTATTLPVGSQNKLNPGAQDRGQPTTFAPGTTANAWSITLTTAEFGTLRWNLDGNTVPLQTATVCAATAVPADGNPLAVLVFGALTSLVGATFLGERRRRARAAG